MRVSESPANHTPGRHSEADGPDDSRARGAQLAAETATGLPADPEAGEARDAIPGTLGAFTRSGSLAGPTRHAA